MSPCGPVSESYWLCASVCAATICERTDWIESVSASPEETSACLADASSGDLERSLQALQNLSSAALTPLSPGSASDSSALLRPSPFAFCCCSEVFWARYCESRNVSRTRLKPVTSTPEPSWPDGLTEPWVETVSAVEAA